MEENQKRKRKEVQAKITALKKSVPKGDRKKKEFVEQIAKLQAELDTDVTGDQLNICEEQTVAVNDICEGVESIRTTDVLECSNRAKPTGRVSKAQKRRDRKAAKESEREVQIADQERENLGGARHLENEKIKNILKTKGLTIFEIPSNGDCLYAAIAHQLDALGAPMSVASLRQQTSRYMRSNLNTFMPFLCDQDSGEPMTYEKFEKYCNDTEDSSTWGGQPELQAISQILQLSIEVIQAEGPAIIIGEEYKHHPKLILIYHRHMYGLGEHYNSVANEVDTPAEDEFA